MIDGQDFGEEPESRRFHQAVGTWCLALAAILPLALNAQHTVRVFTASDGGAVKLFGSAQATAYDRAGVLIGADWVASGLSLSAIASVVGAWLFGRPLQSPRFFGVSSWPKKFLVLASWVVLLQSGCLIAGIGVYSLAHPSASAPRLYIDSGKVDQLAGALTHAAFSLTLGLLAVQLFRPGAAVSTSLAEGHTPDGDLLSEEEEARTEQEREAKLADPTPEERPGHVQSTQEFLQPVDSEARFRRPVE